jgi:hypothetical protein
VPSCRKAALEAAEKQDFEAFHDLAWRAAQKGRPNDPELMYLLARAQSLSGRPGDALVMLRRLVEMGVPTDARDSEDFRRVRAMPGWADLDALIAVAGTKSPPPSPTSPARAPSSTSAGKSPASPVSSGEAAPAAPTTRAAGPTASATASPSAAAGGEEALALNESTPDPVGLAYDSASRRFVVGDRRANKLVVADEVFRRVNDLIGAASAGFGTLTAIDIDSHRGDLWVASTTADGAASIHKLQLVSGRVLSAILLPEGMRPALLSDMMVTDAGALLLVDSTGSRLLTVKGGEFEPPVGLHVSSPVSMAPAIGGVTYIAHATGLARADARSGKSTDVQASSGVTLIGLQRIRWNRGELIAIQTVADGSNQLVRIRLSGGGARATAVEPLDTHGAADGSALTISRDAAYYVARTNAGPVIRRVQLR